MSIDVRRKVRRDLTFSARFLHMSGFGALLRAHAGRTGNLRDDLFIYLLWADEIGGKGIILGSQWGK